MNYELGLGFVFKNDETFKEDTELLQMLLAIQKGQYVDPEANLRSALSRANSIICCYNRHSLLGYLLLGLNNINLSLNNSRPNVYIGTLAVAASHHRNGIGGLLLKKAIEIALSSYEAPLFWGLFTSQNAIMLRKYFKRYAPKDDGTYSLDDLNHLSAIRSVLANYEVSTKHPFKLINPNSYFIFSEAVLDSHNQIRATSYFSTILDTIKYDIRKREVLVYLLEA